MNILSIGNSFATDALRYLHRIARADGVELNTFHLYIGGCSLSRHYRNMLSEETAYTLEMNGQSTGFTVSLKEALLNRDWDVITVQQASHDSVCYDTYQPYLDRLVQYIRTCAPKAKIALHQTWAYKPDSLRLRERMGYDTHEDMFRDVRQAYEKAYEKIRPDYFIPSGEVFQALVSRKIGEMYRDDYHCSYGLGRYAIGLTWYAIFSGKDITGKSLPQFDAEISDEQVAAVQDCVAQITKAYCSEN